MAKFVIIIILLIGILSSSMPVSALGTNINIPVLSTNMKKLNTTLDNIPDGRKLVEFYKILGNIDILITKLNRIKLGKKVKLKLVARYQTVQENIETRIEEINNKNQKIDLGSILSGGTIPNTGIKPIQDIQTENKTDKIIIKDTNPIVQTANSGITQNILQSNVIPNLPINTPVTVVTKKITFNPTTIGLPGNGSMYQNPEAVVSIPLIGGFSVGKKDDATINYSYSKLVFKNIGTVKLSDIVKSRFDISISELNSNELRFNNDCMHLNDNLITLDGCATGQGYIPNSAGNYVFSIKTTSLEGNFGKTVQLSFVPEESNIDYRDTSTQELKTITGSNIINNTVFPILTIQPYPLVKSLEQITPNTYKLVFNNPNMIDLKLNSLRLGFVISPYSPIQLNGSFCIRPVGSNISCDDQYSTNIINSTETQFPIANEDVTIPMKGKLEYELLINGTGYVSDYPLSIRISKFLYSAGTYQNLGF